VDLRRFSILLQLAVLALASAPGSAAAQDIETRGGHCNDTYFGSDGGGLTGCLEYGLRWNDDVIGIGFYGAEPEQFGGGGTRDPLESLARINAWYGRAFDTTEVDYFLAARAGIEGGIADDIGRELQNLVHSLIGENNRDIRSTHGTRLLAGVSGWARNDYVVTESEQWRMSAVPYGHAAVGNDTIEAGGGLLLSLQPAGGAEPLALLLPKTGAYAPAYGGDGIGIFAGARAVALETLYDGKEEILVAEAGVTAQATFFDFAVIGLSASCTSKPYDGAPEADCKATFQMGGKF
jgi:hypothetical protein